MIDKGNGSGATVTHIMSGAYDAGFGDINAIIQNASTKPDDAPVMVYMVWNQPPFAIVTKNGKRHQHHQGFRRPYARWCTGDSDHAASCRCSWQKNKLEGEKIKLSNMAPNLQEPMLIKGDIDAALVFNITSYFNLVLNNQDPDKDYKWFSFGDYGMDLYSNGVMVSRKLIDVEPEGRGRPRSRHQQGHDRGRQGSECRHEGGAEFRQPDQCRRRKAPAAIFLRPS